MHTSQEPAAHLAPLDSLRAFAVTAVVIEHSVPHEWLAVSPGAIGVRVFFALSGFLITRILIKERDHATLTGQSKALALRRFYARRALRILPLFYAVLLTLVIFLPDAIRPSLPWHLAYAGNYYNALQGAWAGPASHFWSLAVEEQFYLVWPLLVLFVAPPRLTGLILICLLAGPVSRVVTFLITSNDVAPYVLTSSCLDGLGAGALLAHLDSTGRLTRTSSAVGYWIALCGVLVFALVTFGGRALGLPLVEVAGADLAVGLFAFGVIHAIVAKDARPVRLLAWKPLTYLGVISYGIYAWHYPLRECFAALQQSVGTRLTLPAPGWWCFAVTMGLTVTIASISWYGFERPLNALKSRFPYLSSTARTRPPSR